MRKLSIEQFRAEVKAQNVGRNDYAFICPMCDTVQSANTLIKAGAGSDFDSVNKYLGFSCVGRFTQKGGPAEEKGRQHGCNWTLGGLFRMHTLEVTTEDNEVHPHFEIATPEQAQRLAETEGVSHHE